MIKKLVKKIEEVTNGSKIDANSLDVLTNQINDKLNIPLLNEHMEGLLIKTILEIVSTIIVTKAKADGEDIDDLINIEAITKRINELIDIPYLSEMVEEILIKFIFQIFLSFILSDNGNQTKQVKKI